MEGKVPSILEYVGEIKNTINGECDLRIENAKQSTMEDFRAGMTVN
ncbi:MAG: hypothetical protein Rpha_1458 [Candidatus Ruthia sp. Apha_13_S6]|nr:hypothetical protein [Candidatus Ruthia sp. Apha_13_S6]